MATVSVSASMDPRYKDCMQRGYQIENNFDQGVSYCVFDNGSKCLIDEFNYGECGSEFMIEDYCVAEGDSVWDKDKCCPGLKPYIPNNMVGQQSCQPKNSQYFYWIFGVIVLVIVFAFLHIRRKH